MDQCYNTSIQELAKIVNISSLTDKQIDSEMAAQELELESRHEKINNWDQDHFISDKDNEIDDELH
jgi:hypothetical protein